MFVIFYFCSLNFGFGFEKAEKPMFLSFKNKYSKHCLSDFQAH